MSLNNNGMSEGDESAAVGSRQLKKGPWTTAEDVILVEYVRKHGEGNWSSVQKNSGLSRCGKSCRLRWANHLRPNLKKGSFSPEEERLILQLHAKLGNKWARMAAQLPGRTDNEIKNYWNTRIKRCQRAGLALYPPDIERQMAFHYQQNYHYRSSQLLSSSTTMPSLQPEAHITSPGPFLDPVNFSTSTTTSSTTPTLSLLSPTLISHHHHTFGPPIQRFKSLRDNNSVSSSGFSPSYPCNSQFSLLGQSLHDHNQNTVQYSPSTFDPSHSALWSSVEPIALNPGGPTSTSLDFPSSKFVDSGQSTSGLPDALLIDQEQVLGGPIEVKCNLRGWASGPFPAGLVFSENATAQRSAYMGQWDHSNVTYSSVDNNSVKNERIEENNSVDEDLSSLLDMLPLSMPTVPEWYSDSGEMPNNAPTSGSGDNIGFEMQQLSSSLASSTEQDWSLNSCTWNNMPGIC